MGNKTISGFWRLFTERLLSSHIIIRYITLAITAYFASFLLGEVHYRYLFNGEVPLGKVLVDGLRLNFPYIVILFAIFLVLLNISRVFFNYLRPSSYRVEGSTESQKAPLANSDIKETRIEIVEKEIKSLTSYLREKDAYPLDTVIRVSTLSKYRLIGEIEDLANRANVNLYIGIVFSVIGIVIIGVSAFQDSVSVTAPSKSGVSLDTVSLIRAYGMKIAVGVFLQIIAFFFLRLYRSSLVDIKYYQNELTNLEGKHQAVVLASTSDDPELLHTVVVNLGNTERNRILDKGQGSIGLEGADKLIDSDFQLIGDLAKIIHSREERKDEKKSEPKKKIIPEG